MSTPTGPGPSDVSRNDLSRSGRGPDHLPGDADAAGAEIGPPHNRLPAGEASSVGDRDVEPGFVGGERPITGNRTDPGVPVQDDTLRRDTVRQEPVRRGALRGDSVRDDSVRDDSLRDAAARDATVRHDVVREEVVGPDPDGLLAADRQTVFAREREAFGGMKLGSAFFGWLTATGLAVLLLALLAAAGVAFGLTNQNADQAVQAAQNATGTAKTVGLISGIVLLVILFLAYYCGGYVAGRMARFNGVKQGLAVWLWFIVITGIIAAIAAIAGSKYNVLSQLNLPRIPVDEGGVTTAGIIAIVAAILAALLGALLGGAVGTRYHRRVDAVGFETR